MKRLTRDKSRVQTPAASPKLVSLATASASSSVSKGMTTATGPKISSWQIRSELSSVMKSVGSTQ